MLVLHLQELKNTRLRRSINYHLFTKYRLTYVISLVPLYSFQTAVYYWLLSINLNIYCYFLHDYPRPSYLKLKAIQYPLSTVVQKKSWDAVVSCEYVISRKFAVCIQRSSWFSILIRSVVLSYWDPLPRDVEGRSRVRSDPGRASGCASPPPRRLAWEDTLCRGDSGEVEGCWGEETCKWNMIITQQTLSSMYFMVFVPQIVTAPAVSVKQNC